MTIGLLDLQFFENSCLLNPAIVFFKKKAPVFDRFQIRLEMIPSVYKMLQGFESSFLFPPSFQYIELLILSSSGLS